MTAYGSVEIELLEALNDAVHRIEQHLLQMSTDLQCVRSGVGVAPANRVTKEAPLIYEGDAVCFAVDEDEYPVWNYQTPRVPEGENITIVTGRVCHKNSRVLITRHIAAGRWVYWNWPLPDHPDYDPKQWERPGYLRPAKIDKKETP